MQGKADDCLTSDKYHGLVFMCGLTAHLLRQPTIIANPTDSRLNTKL